MGFEYQLPFDHNCIYYILWHSQMNTATGRPLCREPFLHDDRARAIMKLDLSRFDAAALIAFNAIKENDYGIKTDG